MRFQRSILTIPLILTLLFLAGGASASGPQALPIHDGVGGDSAPGQRMM
jgi:hypothetical protein